MSITRAVSAKLFRSESVPLFRVFQCPVCNWGNHSVVKTTNFVFAVRACMHVQNRSHLHDLHVSGQILHYKDATVSAFILN